jgi:hypothetical protein
MHPLSSVTSFSGSHTLSSCGSPAAVVLSAYV